MGNHRSKTANVRGCYPAHNTLLELNESKYSLPKVNVFFILVTAVERLLGLDQPRQSNVFVA
jgi:hypothetical protein